MSKAIALFTREAVAEVLAGGGTGNWVTSAERAEEQPLVVLIRNARHPKAPRDVDHGTAFLVGKVSSVRRVAEASAGGYPRVFIEFSAYALAEVPNAWGKSQNPVWYTDLTTLGISEDELKFQPMPHQPASDDAPPQQDRALAIADMKREVGRLFGVPASAVEIAIRP